MLTDGGSHSRAGRPKEGLRLRLHLKITLWIVAIFVAAGGISVYALGRFQRTATLHQFEAMAQTLTLTVLNSLQTTMVHNNAGEAQEIIRNIERERMIRRVAVYAPGGRVWASSYPSEIGSLQPSSLLAKAVTGGAAVAEERQDELRVVTPIVNRVECHGCHDPAQHILGAIAVTLGTSPIEAFVTSHARLLAGLVSFILLLALGTVSRLLSRSVLEPLSAIVQTVRAVSAGDYSARAVVQTGDELGMLARAFNDMSSQVEHSTRALNDRAAELAKRLSALTIFSETLTEAGGPTAAASEAAAAIREMVRADACVVYRLDDGTAVAYASAGPAALAEPWGARAVLDAASGAGEPADAAGHAPGQATLVVPLRAQDRALGGVVVVRASGAPFERSDGGLVAAVARQLSTAIENARLFREVRDKERLRGELLAKLISAHEDERRRIARELHDEVSQSLTGLVMRLNAAEEAAPERDPRAALAAVREMAEGTAEEVRKIVYDLRPSLLDDLGLAPAVRYLAKTVLEQQGVQVRFEVSGFGRERVSQPVETTVFRVAQEAITNVARHARAHSATIAMERRDGTIRLTVADDGVGFDRGAVLGDARRHLGIAGMEERVALLGGRLEIVSRPGSGTTVTVTLPEGVD